MRRLARWLGAALGGLALYRLLARRRREELGSAEAPSEEAPGVDARAEELRQRLREARVLESEREAFEEGETTVDRADPDESVEKRRREVHEGARAAADEMRSAEGSESS